MCTVISFSILRVWSPGRRLKGDKSKGEKRKLGKTKRKDDRGMDAQVLLLMDPGAELGWAELSDTLPSAGRERDYNQHRGTSLFCEIVLC